MLKLVTTNQFEKDFDRIIRRGENKERMGSWFWSIV
jgi:mRNA-degrading endonuclease YafQ of YafQ-DinJ toxin-antitoxin module